MPRSLKQFLLAPVDELREQWALLRAQRCSLGLVLAAVIVATVLLGNVIFLLAVNFWLDLFATKGGPENTSQIAIQVVTTSFVCLFFITLAVAFTCVFGPMPIIRTLIDTNRARGPVMRLLLLFSCGATNAISSVLGVYAMTYTPEFLQAVLMCCNTFSAQAWSILFIPEDRQRDYLSLLFIGALLFMIAGILLSSVSSFMAVGDDGARISWEWTLVYVANCVIFGLWCVVQRLYLDSTVVVVVTAAAVTEAAYCHPEDLAVSPSAATGGAARGSVGYGSVRNRHTRETPAAARAVHDDDDDGNGSKAARPGVDGRVELESEEILETPERKEPVAGSEDGGWDGAPLSREAALPSAASADVVGLDKGAVAAAAAAPPPQGSRRHLASDDSLALLREEGALFSPVSLERGPREEEEEEGKRRLGVAAVPGAGGSEEEEGEEIYVEGFAGQHAVGTANNDGRLHNAWGAQSLTANAAKVTLLAFGLIFQVLVSFAVLPVDAIPWFGTSDSVAHAWERFDNSINFMFESWQNIRFGLLYSLGYIMSFIGCTFLNEHSPTLASVVMQLAGPVTSIVILIIPQWNVYQDQGNVGHKAGGVVLLVCAALLYHMWDQQSLRQLQRRRQRQSAREAIGSENGDDDGRGKGFAFADSQSAALVAITPAAAEEEHEGEANDTRAGYRHNDGDNAHPHQQQQQQQRQQPSRRPQSGTSRGRNLTELLDDIPLQSVEVESQP